MKVTSIGLASLAGLCLASPAAAQMGPLPLPESKDNATIVVPDFDLPFSTFGSAEARASLDKRLKTPAGPPPRGMAEVRANTDKSLMPQLEAHARLFPYKSAKSVISGVTVETFIPDAGIAPENANRVLLHVHGGGMVAGGGGPGGAVESIPIAGTMRIKVVSVDYRLQPEHPHPAQVEDMTTVYRDLLKTYRPENIGIYGCSAGGALAAWSPTWFTRHDLPLPGALGVFCASIRGFGGGDSAQLWPRMASVLPMIPPPPPPQGSISALNPDIPDEILRIYPPTLHMTGTRAPEMSGATQGHLDLLAAGRESELLLFDGLDHGFYSNPDFPESRRAYTLIARFFDEHLGKEAK